MIFIDSNIPMYLVGAAHPHKAGARELLEGAIAASKRLVTSVEVLQEILHRYVAIGRRDAIQPAFDALLGVVDEVIPIQLIDVERAREFVLGIPDLSARDAIHAAVMARNSVELIMTFDATFDSVPGIRRFRV
ncbi:MAG TPA: type II toxin-antitoxin system VapC family toxin [Casimicrobiaceae bacterium]|nr:type II toxin-antitoxin system VapC family toxin [Casimicrobiaceae bacterium]